MKRRYMGKRVKGDKVDCLRKLGDFVIGIDLLEDHTALHEIREVVRLLGRIEEKTNCVLVKDLLKDLYESYPVVQKIRAAKKHAKL